MLFSLNLREISWVIVGDGIFWNPKNILTLPHNRYQMDDLLFICDEQTSSNIRAIPFSTYDGFAIKNILGHVLKIPSAVIHQSSNYDKIIQERCQDLKIPFYFKNIQDKPQFIIQFCIDHQCKLQDIAIFDQDLKLSDFFEEKPGLLISSPSSKEFPKHFLRSFVNSYADYDNEVLSYYYETRIHRTNGPQNFRSSTKTIKALICDIDGTCTDGYKIYGEDGSLWKCFSFLDIRALKAWNNNGKLIFFITGESNFLPQKFAEECQISADHVFLNAGSQKVQILHSICQKNTLTFAEIAYIGDDMNDLGIIEFLIEENGIAACPANAMPMIKSTPHILQLKTRGGYGAVAEFIQILNS